MFIKNRRKNTIEIFSHYWLLMNSTLFISVFMWVFDVLGSCFLEQQLASHFIETACGMHHRHLNCSTINVQKKK